MSVRGLNTFYSVVKLRWKGSILWALYIIDLITINRPTPELINKLVPEEEEDWMWPNHYSVPSPSKYRIHYRLIASNSIAMLIHQLYIKMSPINIKARCTARDPVTYIGLGLPIHKVFLSLKCLNWQVKKTGNGGVEMERDRDMSCVFFQRQGGKGIYYERQREMIAGLAHVVFFVIIIPANKTHVLHVFIGVC